MKKIKLFLSSLLLLTLAASAVGCAAKCVSCAANAASAPRELTAEYRMDPEGIDTSAPRLSWKMGQGLRRGSINVTQSAYRILVASSREKLAKDTGDLWDSGKVMSARSLNIEYAGKPFTSSQSCWWKVKTWCHLGNESDWSAPAHWTAGIMRPSDWKAKWIGPAAVTRPDTDLGGARWIWTGPTDDLTKAPAGLTFYRKSFDFEGTDASSAAVVELVHAAVYRHEIFVNGRLFSQPSGHIHNPYWARFRDLTPFLKKGRNEILVRVESVTPGEIGFLAAIRFPCGKKIVTDETWEASVSAPKNPREWAKESGAFTWKPAKTAGTVRQVPWGAKMQMREELNAPAFRKTFTVAKPIAAAVLHVTGVGFYEASLNGAKIGDKVLDPAPTAYDKRVLYSTYPLTEKLRPGVNTLEVLVGHGWYDVRSIATWNFDVAPWRDFPRMIAQLALTYTDGTTETIVSDKTWRQVRSPVAYDCIREGEVIHGAHHKAIDLESKTIFAEEVPSPKGRLVAESCPGAKIVRELKPASIHKAGEDGWIIAFSENFAGWVRLRIHGQSKGDVLSIRYDERVDADFMPAVPSPASGAGNDRSRGDGAERRRIDCHFRYTASQAFCPQDAAFQTDRYICSGAASEMYEPRFTYNGFRYVYLKGLAFEPAAEDIVGCVISTDFKTVGSFESSDPTLNTLMEMADRSYRSNFVDGYPTDCPHREKNGWTGDASIASELAQFCYENTAAYEKWLGDIADAQLPDGNIPGIVPTSGWGFQWGNGPAWDSALPVITWMLYTHRADTRILDIMWPVLKKYVDYTTTRAENGLVRHGLGDWIPVNRNHMPAVEFTSSCFYLQAAQICARIAEKKGLAHESAHYNQLAVTIRVAINRKYAKGNGVYENGGQTAQSFALAFGVVPERERAAAEARLVDAVVRADGHVDVGLLGMKHVFRALSRAGRTDLAFRMLTNPTPPSPIEWIQKGGTALWEDWKDGASRNHIMFGDFAAWAYQYLAGIRPLETEGSCAAVPLVEKTAFAEFLIAPQPIDLLTFVRASVNGPYGEIVSAWKRDGKKFTLDVTIPPNTKARVRLPGQADRRVGSGTYTFTIDLP